jgi:hypothetical protein
MGKTLSLLQPSRVYGSGHPDIDCNVYAIPLVSRSFACDFWRNMDGLKEGSAQKKAPTDHLAEIHVRPTPEAYGGLGLKSP